MAGTFVLWCPVVADLTLRSRAPTTALGHPIDLNKIEHV
jgi:hypothetical protein